jgi:hypothetical protein
MFVFKALENGTIHHGEKGTFCVGLEVDLWIYDGTTSQLG